MRECFLQMFTHSRTYIYWVFIYEWIISRYSLTAGQIFIEYHTVVNNQQVFTHSRADIHWVFIQQWIISRYSHTTEHIFTEYLYMSEWSAGIYTTYSRADIHWVISQEWLFIGYSHTEEQIVTEFSYMSELLAEIFKHSRADIHRNLYSETNEQSTYIYVQYSHAKEQIFAECSPNTVERKWEYCTILCDLGNFLTDPQIEVFSIILKRPREKKESWQIKCGAVAVFHSARSSVITALSWQPYRPLYSSVHLLYFYR